MKWPEGRGELLSMACRDGATTVLIAGTATVFVPRQVPRNRLSPCDGMSCDLIPKKGSRGKKASEAASITHDGVVLCP